MVKQEVVLRFHKIYDGTTKVITDLLSIKAIIMCAHTHYKLGRSVPVGVCMCVC